MLGAPDWIGLLLLGIGFGWLIIAFLEDRSVSRLFPQIATWLPVTPSIDWNAWDNLNRFRLGVAASLWVERPPTSRRPVDDDARYPVFQMLKEAIDEGDLEPIALNGENANLNTWVSREELIKYAQDKELEPLFLFPERRPS